MDRLQESRVTCLRKIFGSLIGTSGKKTLTLMSHRRDLTRINLKKKCFSCHMERLSCIKICIIYEKKCSPFDGKFPK